MSEGMQLSSMGVQDDRECVLMEIADMFRTEKQRQIIQALERIHMGTTRDIIDAIGCKNPTYAYGRHIQILIDEGVVHVCGYNGGKRVFSLLRRRERNEQGSIDDHDSSRVAGRGKGEGTQGQCAQVNDCCQSREAIPQGGGRMKCIYNTWLDDLVIDGLKYVKVKEERANDDDTILLLLCAYCSLKHDKKLEALLTGKEAKE